MHETIQKRGRPHTAYRLADGTRVPSVTTILGVIAKPALYKWHNQQGLKGIDTSQTVQAAADAGTACHYLIECHLTGKTPDVSDVAPDLLSLAENGYLRWLDWEKSIRDFELIFSEKPMVSELRGFGGTIDIFAKVDGKNTLIDIKTSDSGIWPEMRHQVAAYRELLLDNGHKVDDVIIVRTGKNESRAFEVEHVENLEDHFSVFIAAKLIYKLQQDLGRK